MTAAFVRITLYATLVITPLVLVGLLRLETHHVFVYELGKNFGLLGFTILAMQFVLSARLKWVERPFGLDMLLSFHKCMAFFAVTLLLIHPALVAIGDEGWSLLLGLDVPYYIWLARAALTILLIHGFVSVFRLSLRLEFERWRLLHNILAFSVLVLGFFHSWNAGHDLSAVPMQFLWGSLLGVAVLTYLYHRGLRPFWHRRHAYQVIDVLKETHNVWTIRLAPPEGQKCYAYLPGQFHFLTLYRGRGLPLEEHPFTISSSPTQEGFVSSTIKASGDFTALIGQTNPGDAAGLHGPFGRFCYVLHPDEGDLVFIAGGIGITPLMSMLRHMRDTQSKRHVLLLYANKTERDIVFGDELTAMESGELEGLTVVYILSQGGDSWIGESGRVDREKIERLCGSIADKAFYVCGPPTMIEKVIEDLRDLGVADARIHAERFSL